MVISIDGGIIVMVVVVVIVVVIVVFIVCIIMVVMIIVISIVLLLLFELADQQPSSCVRYTLAIADPTNKPTSQV